MSTVKFNDAYAKDIVDRTGLSIQEIFNEAMTLYSHLLDAAVEGKSIAIIDKDANEYQAILLKGASKARANAKTNTQTESNPADRPKLVLIVSNPEPTG